MIPRTLHASYLQSSRMALKNADSALFCIKVSIEKKRLWRIEWARYQWFNSQKNFDPIEAENPEPWYLQYQDEIELGKGINEDELGVTITFPKDEKCLVTHIYILDSSISYQSSEGPKTNEDIRNTMQKHDPNREIGVLEFYAAPGDPSP